MDVTSLKQTKVNTAIPKLGTGDNVKVSFKIKEANRERLQIFSGLVIKVTRSISGGNFTVRKVTSGIGVEHTFPFASPLLEKIEIVRHGKVRRSRLFYIRRLSTKEARLKERRERSSENNAKADSADTMAVSVDSTESIAEAK